MAVKRILKPVVVFTLAAFVLTSAGFGQTRRHDLSLSFGVLSIDQMADVLGDVLTIIITLGTFSKNEVKYTGVPFLTYHHSRNDRFGFGFAVGGYKSSGALRIGDLDGRHVRGEQLHRGRRARLPLGHAARLPALPGAGFGVRLRRAHLHRGRARPTRSTRPRRPSTSTPSACASGGTSRVLRRDRGRLQGRPQRRDQRPVLT
ncbi:MAG: hypothetical protein M0C28_47725 [Candidatus Moduliflexus flocculans]|nr:hypothetical protein [Candidatus Moduliflexus flocculans]